MGDIWGCSLDVLVLVLVFVFFIVIDSVIVFLLVMSCVLITLITCPKGHKSLRVLYGSLFQQCVVVSEWVSQWVTRSPIELFWTAKNEQQGVGEEKCREERKGVKKETDVAAASFQSMQITSMAQNWGDSLQCKTKSSSLQGKTIQCSAGKEVNHFAVLSAQSGAGKSANLSWECRGWGLRGVRG